MARAGRPRNDTEDHGKGDGIVLVLVLSAAVLVIVIDARDVGVRKRRASGVSRKGAKFAKWMARVGFNTKPRRTRSFLGEDCARGGHGMTRKITERE